MTKFELMQEKFEDDAREELMEQSLRNDFDYFLEQHSDIVEDLVKSYEEIEQALKSYDWDYSPSAIIEIIKEY